MLGRLLRWRRRSFVLVFWWILLASALPLLTPPTGWTASVVISPARLEAVIGLDGRLPPLTVANSGDAPVLIRFSLAGGGHDLSGAPLLDESEPVMARLARQIRIIPDELLLAPAEVRQVALWAQPGGKGGLYPIVVVDIMPEESATPAGVATRTRIAIPALLIYPAVVETERDAPLTVSDIRLSQEAPGRPLLISAVMQNRSSVHVRAGAQVTIAGAGRTDSIVAAPVTILPGAARRIQAEWAPPLLEAGVYHVSVQPAAGGAAAETAFAIISQYELAQLHMELDRLDVSAPASGGVLVRVLVANNGNVPGDTRLELELNDWTGRRLAREEWLVPDLPPNTGREVSGILPLTLAAGEYGLLARLWQADVEVASLMRTFQVTPEPVLAAR